MALGGINAGLNTGVPSGTSQAGAGQQDLRSIKTTFQQVLDSEHHFPSTGGAGSGAHRLGSGRAFYGASSKLSSSDTDGRLYIDSTNSRLHHAGSSNTILLGGQYAVLAHPAVRSQNTSGAASLVTSAITQHWVLECGHSVVTRDFAVVPLQNTYVAGAVIVAKTNPEGVTSWTTWDVGVSLSLSFSNDSSFLVYAFETNGSSSTPASPVYFDWQVMGIVGL